MDFSELALRLTESGSLPIIAAFLIGLLAAISPCPMATNITAMAYISRNITDRKYVVTSGLLYMLGRMVSYSVVGVLVILVGLSVPGISEALQDWGERILGPLLIIVGILMLGIIKIPLIRGGGRLSSLAERVANKGRLGAFLMGFIFALAFCPYTAILFFAVLIPLAMQSTGGITFPAVFALGTGLPVLIFAVLLSFGVAKVSQWFNKVTAAERVMRRIVALVFIGVGIYYVVLLIQG